MNARLVLVGGPFDGQTAFELPPDTPAPAQIVWSGAPGCQGHIYEHRGDRTTVHGYTESLLYYWTGRRVPPKRVPHLLSQDTELWADGADLLMLISGYPPEILWPGV